MTQGQDTRQLVRELMTLPAAEQSSVLRRYLKSYAKEDAAQRAGLIRMLLEATGELSAEQRKKYAKVRASAISQFPMGTQMALLGTYREVLSGLPEDRAEQEKETLESILPELKGADRMAAQRFLNYLPPLPNEPSGQRADQGRRRRWKFWA